MWTLYALRANMPAWKTLHARWWSRLKFFPCHATRIAGFIPVLLVYGILGFAYFTAVPATLIPLYTRTPGLGSFLLVIFHFIYLNVIINYSILVFADPGGVPVDWQAPPPSEEMRTSGIVDFPHVHLMKDRAYDGGLRYCRHCRCYKPDRAHHCSACRRCILRMDHHCVFVNNCVSFLNHKFFLSFVAYAFLGCLFVAVSAFPTVSKIVFEPLDGSVERPRGVSETFETCTVVGYALCVAFTFALGIFVVFHAFLVAKGRTTIELYEISDASRAAQVKEYDLGPAVNIRKACGSVPLCWLCPTRAHIEGDGLSYERVDNHDYEEQV